ncbi:hypothetical protein [Methylomonas sp. MgM2]
MRKKRSGLVNYILWHCGVCEEGKRELSVGWNNKLRFGPNPVMFAAAGYLKFGGRVPTKLSIQPADFPLYSWANYEIEKCWRISFRGMLIVS